MFYVYVLEDQAEEHYIGFTADLKRRLLEHNAGKNLSTKNRKWKCVYYEACVEELDARRRERYFKTNQGRRLLKRRIKEYLYKKRAG